MVSIISVFDYFKANNFNIIDYETTTDIIYFYKINYNKLLEIIKIIDDVLNLSIDRIAYYNQELYLKLNL